MSVVSNSWQSYRLYPTRLFLSMGFFQQKYWSRLSSPPPGDLLNPGIKPAFPVTPALPDGFFTTSHLGSPL